MVISSSKNFKKNSAFMNFDNYKGICKLYNSLQKGLLT
jgi:hypothetical protein